MKFSEWKLLEKRKNPEQNPKISTYEALKPFFKEENVFVSFTDLDKLGINPQSDYNTPIGIYSYPLKQMYEKNQKEWNIHKKVFFPFASNRPYIWVFKPKPNANIMELSKYSSKDFDRDIDKLQKMGYNVDKYIDKMKSEAKHNSPAGFFWYITMSIIRENYESFKQRTLKWNVLFRELGYDGFTDKTGMGIIHESEPMQAVFFKKDDIEVIDKVLNKYYGKDVETELKNEIKNIKTSKDIDNYLKKYGDFIIIGEMNGQKKFELEKIVISHGNPELYWRLSFAFTKHFLTSELYMDSETIIKHEAIDIIRYEDRINENQLLRILFVILTWDKKTISDNFLNQFFDYFNHKDYDYIISFFPDLSGINPVYLLKFIQNKNNRMDKRHFSKLLNIFYDADIYKDVIEYILSLNYDFREDVKNILKNKDLSNHMIIIFKDYLNKNIKESVKITEKRIKEFKNFSDWKKQRIHIKETSIQDINESVSNDKNNNIKVYHGDNFGLTHINKNYDRIADPKGNMANGLGIYFAKDIKHAKRYGNKIVSTEIDINKLLPAKEYLDDYISADKMARLLHYFFINSEDFWMNYADYGIEVIEKEDYKKHYSYEMAKMIIEEQVRNVMIDLWQKVRDTQIFVDGWLKYIGYYGTYEKIDNDIVVALIYNEKPVKRHSDKSITESKEKDYILLLDEYETIRRGIETYYWDDDKKDIAGDRPEKYYEVSVIDKNSINQDEEIIRNDYLENLPYLAGEEITISKEIEYITLNDKQIDILVNENYPDDFDYNDYISELIENSELEYEIIQEKTIKMSDPADEIEEMYNEIKEHVEKYKNLELSISEARTTNSIYITVTNIENDNSITIRISDHSSNLDSNNDYNLLTSQNFKRGFEDIMFSVDTMDDVYFAIEELSEETLKEFKEGILEENQEKQNFIYSIGKDVFSKIFVDLKEKLSIDNKDNLYTFSFRLSDYNIKKVKNLIDTVMVNIFIIDNIKDKKKSGEIVVKKTGDLYHVEINIFILKYFINILIDGEENIFLRTYQEIFSHEFNHLYYMANNVKLLNKNNNIKNVDDYFSHPLEFIAHINVIINNIENIINDVTDEFLDMYKDNIFSKKDIDNFLSIKDLDTFIDFLRKNKNFDNILKIVHMLNDKNFKYRKKLLKKLNELWDDVKNKIFKKQKYIKNYLKNNDENLILDKELSGEESIDEKKEFKNFSECKKSFIEDVDSDRGYINIARVIWDSIFTTGEKYEKYFDFENNCFTIPLATFMGISAKNQILKIKFRDSERMGGSAGWYKNLNDNVHEIAIGYNRRMMGMYVSDNSGYNISVIHLVKKFDKFKKYIYKEKIFKNFRDVFVHEFKHLINFLRFKGGKDEYEKAKEYNPNKQTMLQAYVKSEQEYDSYFMNLITFIEENIFIDYISSFEYLLKRIKEEMNKNYPAGRISIDYYILFVEWRKKTLRRLYQHFKQWKKEQPTPEDFPGFPEEEGNTLPNVSKEFKNFSEWKKSKHLTK